MNIRYRRELYKLLPNVGQAVCAEIGVAEGYNSAEMLSWGIKKLYMIDAWETMSHLRGDAASPQDWHNANYEAAMERVKRYQDRYEVLRGPSARMAEMIPDDSLDLTHIDGDHSYEGVMADLVAYWPKMKRGGIISGHDYMAAQYGVREAVRDFTKDIHVHVLPEDKMEDAGFYFYKP